jgi:hypothetical protein
MDRARRCVMGEGWAYQGGPTQLPAEHCAVTLVDGSTFCISDRTGDVRTSHPNSHIMIR